MTIDIAKLRAIASAATQPGPWTTNESDTGETTVLDAHGMWVADVGEAPADALHIAAFSPSACLELLARLERAERDIARWEVLGEKHDIALREDGYKCHQEIGDSPCPVHDEASR